MLIGIAIDGVCAIGIMPFLAFRQRGVGQLQHPIRLLLNLEQMLCFKISSCLEPLLGPPKHRASFVNCFQGHFSFCSKGIGFGFGFPPSSPTEGDRRPCGCKSVHRGPPSHCLTRIMNSALSRYVWQNAKVQGFCESRCGAPWQVSICIPLSSELLVNCSHCAFMSV